ncbi:septum site-determining protein minc [Heliomicrobium modesticaldum Ice1]|uniref:Probable septum site-determining protein MinC n=2 Tax=Heliomicrobium modesticaldum TaxID=35701 RepID=MINC_HELMI|nr:septum site-determining protein MinC [Heliomicrobium modesticaldum]B0TBY2.1 RecName: Full=Probable septum site-determining protein MinC [Heliomicrobium modesticaldum Ice1]ABZ85255.1 septum site-determining protein minc [Heliomicrobium modesticaldum Ice1]
MGKADIVIKGSKDGLTFFLDSQCDFSELAAAIETKLASADFFLVGAHVTVDVGTRQLHPDQIERLQTLFPSYGLILRGINSWADPVGQHDEEERVVLKGNRERIYQIANHLYESTERADGAARNYDYRDESASSFSPVGTAPDYAEATTEPADCFGGSPSDMQTAILTQGGDERTLLIQRTLRSGQTVRYPGHVVILGDVNPGAEVVAGGNIIVMGVFRGVAHAGAMGSDEAVVTAYRLRPTQLRIANHITRPPDEEEEGPEHPEIARIRDGMVTIERYHYGTKSYGKDV